MKKFCYSFAPLLLMGCAAGTAGGQSAVVRAPDVHEIVGVPGLLGVPDIHGLWIQPPDNLDRTGLQYFFFKQTGNRFFGIVCNGDSTAPCLGDTTFPIEDGTINGDEIVFYIGHIDLGTGKYGGDPYRNMFTGKIQGNVITWNMRRDPNGPDDGFTGRMQFIGPIHQPILSRIAPPYSK